MTSKYSTEQKTLRAKLDHLIKWTRDLKVHLMKQSCKILQTRTNAMSQGNLINQIHDDLDEYKHKFDREIGRIHDICDALNTIEREKSNGNIRDEILEALRRSPTYSSLERHLFDAKTPRIRIHPGQKRTVRTALSTDAIKRKASQPISVQILDSSGPKRRAYIDSFKRSRSFANVEHHETQLGMDYIEEDDNDLAWKPFGPKKSISVHSKQSNNDNQSSDEEFDVAWQRRVKKQAQKETTAAATVVVEPRNLDENTQDTSDQNSNEIVALDDDNQTTCVRKSISYDKSFCFSTFLFFQQEPTEKETNQIILDSSSSDDEIITIGDDDDDESLKKSSIIKQNQPSWTTSEIEITTGDSQSQSLHNPYRIGIADPSIRSVYLSAPSNSQTTNNGNRKSGGRQRRTVSNKNKRKN